MHSRRTPAVSPLAIVLPHPPLPRRRSSLLSLGSNGSSPQTPRSCGSPATSAIFFTPSRRSTDSWNSSNADELEWEWKPDQVLLLSRTLDALPAHLVTPFNGPIPPPNLLDKIAREVSKAKGPTDWPHSVRATRVKLIELFRLKAKEEALAEQRRNQIPEEPEVEIADDSDYNSYAHGGDDHPIGIGARRPLYRQSSMDFLDSAGTNLKKNDNIARLSRRLQRSDRVFANPGYHPYSRRNAQGHRRSSSPPPLTKVPSLISPSTQSSDTLDSLDSFDSDPGAKRRSLSSLSSMSVISMGSSGIAIPDPRVQRIRRSESVSMGAPLLPPKDRVVKPSSGLKRAPSYGAMAQEVRREHLSTKGGHVRRDSGSYPSSDEEEKRRTKQAKKQRTKTPESPPARSSVSPASKTKKTALDTPPPVPEKDRTYVRSRAKVVSPAPPQDENVQVPASPIKTKKVAHVEGAKKKQSERRPGAMNTHVGTAKKRGLRKAYLEALKGRVEELDKVLRELSPANKPLRGLDSSSDKPGWAGNRVLNPPPATPAESCCGPRGATLSAISTLNEHVNTDDANAQLTLPDNIRTSSINPLWHKDDKGKTVFNAYRSFCKLHEPARPIFLRLANDCLRADMIKVTLGSMESAADPDIQQTFEGCSDVEKRKQLIKHLDRISGENAKILIIVATEREADGITRYLRQDGWPALAIHSKKEQRERDWVLGEYKAGRSPILVATNVASRELGLGVKDFGYVINYDVPNNSEGYMHRIGRTGISAQNARVTDNLTKYLPQDGWPALAPFYGGWEQRERDWVLGKFKTPIKDGGILTADFDNPETSAYSYFIRDGQDSNVDFTKMLFLTEPATLHPIPQATIIQDAADSGGGKQKLVEGGTEMGMSSMTLAPPPWLQLAVWKFISSLKNVMDSNLPMKLGHRVVCSRALHL